MSNAIDIIMATFSRDGAHPQVVRDERGTYAVNIDGTRIVHVATRGADRIELFATIHPDTSEARSASPPLEWFSSDICDPPFDWRIGIQARTGMAMLCAGAQAAALDAVTFAAGMETFIGHLRRYAAAFDADGS